jgi:ABC-2 type transport system permease protein
MRNSRLYLRYLGISVRSQLQYRLSFVLSTIGNLSINAAEFLGIWAVISRFGSIAGWTLGQIAVFYGTVNVAFAVADAITAGFDQLGTLIRHGEFDRYLLRPRSTVLQLFGYEFTLRRVGRLFQGLVVLTYGLIVALPHAAPVVQMGKAVLLLWTITGCTSFFTGLMLMQASLAFKTVESLEIMNVFTYGGEYAAEYPFSIYNRWLRRFLTFVIPLTTVTYYPVLTILNETASGGVAPWVGWVTPFAGFAFLAISLWVWRAATRWYASTGS